MQIKINKLSPITRYMSASFLLLLLLASLNFAQTQKISTSEKLDETEMIQEAEELLSEKGYLITKVDKTKDRSTFYAISSFQKVEGRKRTGVLNMREVEAMRHATRPAPIFIGAKHIEVDLKRQVLFLVDENDIVTLILPVSTGNEKAYYQNGKKAIARTPRGAFTITRQIKGIRRAPLGILYHPSYFHRGFAIHGSDSIPFYPASHGCVRIPRFAAKDLSDLVSVGLVVIIHENDGKRQIQIDPLNEKLIAANNRSRDIPCTTEAKK